MANNDLVKYKWQNEELKISSDIIKRYISTSKNVTEQEVKDFMDLCIYQHLNPYIKEAYLVKYGTERANIITSKDVFDKRAFRDPQYDGEEITNNYKRGMNLMDLWVRTRIYHKGLSHPASDVTVYYPEYVGKKKDGTINKIWYTKPVTMLTKVSKAQAKREANPEELAKLYLSEEFDQQSKPTETDIREIDVTPQSEHTENKPQIKKESSGNNELATQPQKDIIYGNVVCEECGTRVYGYRCPKCKNTDLHVITGGFYHSHLMTKDDFKKEMEPTTSPYELTKVEAIKIYSWWRGDKDKLVIGERTKREAIEKQAKPKVTKADKIKKAREIVEGKLEIRDENAKFPDGSTPDKAIDYRDLPE